MLVLIWNTWITEGVIFLLDVKIHSAQVYWKLQSWARDLLEEHKKCVIYGSDEKLEPHHVIKCKNTDPLYFSPDNGVVICHNCHKMYHRKYTDINPRTFVEFSQKYALGLKKNRMKRF